MNNEEKYTEVYCGIPVAENKKIKWLDFALWVVILIILGLLIWNVVLLTKGASQCVLNPCQYIKDAGMSCFVTTP